MEKTMYGILKTTGICPIMVAPEVDFAADAAHAIAEGGLPVCEVLLHRDEYSLDRIKKIAKDAPEVTVGAGSVISIKDAEEALKNLQPEYARALGGLQTLLKQKEVTAAEYVKFSEEFKAEAWRAPAFSRYEEILTILNL